MFALNRPGFESSFLCIFPIKLFFRTFPTRWNAAYTIKFPNFAALLFPKFGTQSVWVLDRPLVTLLLRRLEMAYAVLKRTSDLDLLILVFACVSRVHPYCNLFKAPFSGCIWRTQQRPRWRTLFSPAIDWWPVDIVCTRLQR